MPSANQRLGEYVLVDRIGHGGFGEVWRARHHAWADRVVAIKIPTDAQYVRDLQREGDAIQRLSHPNIVRAIAFDPYCDPAYFVMEYVPGMNLRQLLGRGPVEAQGAVAVMRQVLAALHHAHRHGLVHGDVKPENILIHERAARKGLGPGTVKLADFGLGKVAAGAGQDSMVYSRDARDAGRAVGSAQYMAPEQMDGGAVDARADLYACGVILFEMLTGHRPAGTDMPSDVNPAGVPKWLDEVFRRAYARLERRYASAEEFFNALNQSGGIAAALEPAERSHWLRRKLAWIVGGAAAAIILTILAVLPRATEMPALVATTARSSPLPLPSVATTSSLTGAPDSRSWSTSASSRTAPVTQPSSLVEPIRGAQEVEGAMHAAVALATPLRGNAVELPVAPGKRGPLPDADVLEALQRQLPVSDQARPPVELIREASGTADRAMRLALLQTAREKGIAGGDVGAALSAVDEIAREYEIDVLGLKVDALDRAALDGASAAALWQAAGANLTLSDTAEAAHRYDVAERLAASALRLSRSAGDGELIRRVTLRVLAVQKLRADAAKTATATRPAASGR